LIFSSNLLIFDISNNISLYVFDLTKEIISQSSVKKGVTPFNFGNTPFNFGKIFVKVKSLEGRRGWFDGNHET
jgi:hypothetical protein